MSISHNLFGLMTSQNRQKGILSQSKNDANATSSVSRPRLITSKISVAKKRERIIGNLKDDRNQGRSLSSFSSLVAHRCDLHRPKDRLIIRYSALDLGVSLTLSKLGKRSKIHHDRREKVRLLTPTRSLRRHRV